MVCFGADETKAGDGSGGRAMICIEVWELALATCVSVIIGIPISNFIKGMLDRVLK